MPAATEDLVEKSFVRALKTHEDKSPAVAAIETLYEVLSASKANTLSGLSDELKQTVERMRQSDVTVTSVNSASELFMRFISLASLEQPNFCECRRVLLDRGQQFLVRIGSSRQKIVHFSQPFIKNGATILTHSYSRVVSACLVQAAAQGKTFHVYVTESRPDQSGYRMKHQLNEAGLSCTVILDAAATYIMEKVDAVMIGAEGVVETGGIINKIGTANIAVAASALNKPLYVLAESIKFVKEYPLSQRDIPDIYKYRASTLAGGGSVEQQHPLVDYTPPEHIRLLFTDLGILTPAAVSDELIKLYL